MPGNQTKSVRPPASVPELKSLIARRRIVFPSRLEHLTRAVLKEPEIVAFGSSASIARRCGVSTTTVLRLSRHLGFATFHDMRRLFQTHICQMASIRS